jgi:hypothetical protein
MIKFLPLSIESEVSSRKESGKLTEGDKFTPDTLCRKAEPQEITQQQRQPFPNPVIAIYITITLKGILTRHNLIFYRACNPNLMLLTQ